MRAKYEIYLCPGTRPSDSVDHVVIDVSDDPTYFENCIKAVGAAGCDPYEQCGNGCGPKYKARFVDYADETVEVPVELIDLIAEVLTVNQKASISRDSQCVRNVAVVLEAIGYVDKIDLYTYVRSIN